MGGWEREEARGRDEPEQAEAGLAADSRVEALFEPPSLERPDQLEADRVRAAIRRRLFDAPSAPPRLGRFELREQIGAGAMGSVFVARDVELRRDVALKVIRPRAEHARAVRRRLLREARAMAQLRHPNVITVFEAGVIDDQAFIAMEYVDGWTLREWLSEQPRSWQQILDVFVQAGRGLAAAHDAGLVHRDFKPDNVLINRDGRVQVTDFGLARALEAAAGQEPLSALSPTTVPTAGLTRTAVTEWARAGTPRYMPPEQHLGQEVNELSDQFAFCVALFEALHGEPPFAGDTVSELSEAVQAGQVRRPTKKKQVPRWLSRAMARGLSPEPEQRFASMPALLIELQTEPGPGRRWVGPAVLAVALAGGAYALGQMSGPKPTAGPAHAEPTPREVVLADDRAVVSAAGLASAAVANAAKAARKPR